VNAQATFYQENLDFFFQLPAQSHISLVFCRSPGFLVSWVSSLMAESDWRIFCVLSAIAKTRKLVFLKKTVHRVGEKVENNGKPGRNPR
jgi:hypothetical protein